ncbi:Fpg/Nei family DNA glycosylase [Agromyces protaetiae]|uniref:Fpg/Nei family DNA glycosylase n=1 Tax=Agromyces protaetiae TaxID=2509455 RepID=A0A4P6FCE5_9MICO|nr:DNA-formamidopyrimidine glycosylase family protein [Agromyces protaetiae]QAY73534.1 Fpg/Nei family DNA glycosylase [Agromyces protaetiae]
MPESPEVEALAEALGERLTGRALASVDLVEFRVVKSRGRPPESLVGQSVTGAERLGKHVDLAFGAQHLVVSLGRHGWAAWGDEETPDASAAPDSPVHVTLATLGFDGGADGDGNGDGDGLALDLTDAGDWVSLGVFVVDDPREVPAIAKLGPDPASPGFTRADFDRAFVGRRKQLKAVLQEQESLAGIGNAYSDEILFAARLSPVAHASTLEADELDRLFAATVGVVRDAIAARRGIPISRLKAAKVAAMQVHGRAGEPCPAGCGGVIRSFSFASTTAEYCPECQTGGEILPLKA